MPFDLIVSKGKNELKVHYRWYTEIASCKRKKHGEKPSASQFDRFCDGVITDCVANGQDDVLRRIHYSLWGNFPPYRSFLEKHLSGHFSFGRNLRLAVNYFKNQPNDIEFIYRLFFEVVSK